MSSFKSSENIQKKESGLFYLFADVCAAIISCKIVIKMVWLCFTQEVNHSELYEPRCEKTVLRDFRPGLVQTGLYSHKRWLEA